MNSLSIKQKIGYMIRLVDVLRFEFKLVPFFVQIKTYQALFYTTHLEGRNQEK